MRGVHAVSFVIETNVETNERRDTTGVAKKCIAHTNGGIYKVCIHFFSCTLERLFCKNIIAHKKACKRAGNQKKTSRGTSIYQFRYLALFEHGRLDPLPRDLAT